MLNRAGNVWRSGIRRVGASLLVAGILGHPHPARGQSIGDTVEKHVKDELEDDENEVRDKKQKQTRRAEKPREKSDPPRKKPRRKKSSRKSSPERTSRSGTKVRTGGSETRPTSTSTQRTSTQRSSRNEAPRQSGVTVNGKKVNFLSPGREPPRVIGENFEIDPQGGFGLRGWHADSYPALQIKTSHYPQWYVGFSGRFFKKLRIYNAFYQSVGLRSPRNTGAVIAKAATKAAPNAATKVLGVMGIQVKFILVPMFRYEARSFEATAIPTQPVRIIPYDADPEDDVSEFELTEEELYAVSNFETFVVGLHYNDRMKGPDGELIPPKILPFYFGAGFTQYRKPYQVRVGDGVLDELVFNSRFRGGGLALGFDIAGGIDKLGVHFESQVGLGQINLMREYTLNQALPSDWFIGYAQGNLEIDYTVSLLKTRPTLLLSPVASAGGTTFFYVNKKGDSDETPLANWDVLWMGMARLIVPL